MPKISISERDLTSGRINNLNNNVAYIPGYAIMGPVNEPIQCNTLEEFQSIFGKKPYKFITTQKYPDAKFSADASVKTPFARIDEYEKSYIYAAELLRNGLPVLYERVMVAPSTSSSLLDYDTKNNTYIEKWTAKYIEGSQLELDDNTVVISAKNPGSYGTHIGVKIERVGETSEYDISVIVNGDVDKGIESVIAPPVRISLDETSPYFYMTFKSPYINLYIKDGTKSIAEQKSYVYLKVDDSFYSKALTEDASVTLESEGVLNTDEFTSLSMYIAFDADVKYESNTTLFSKLAHKGEFNVKYITSGAYPIFEYDSISNVCGKVTEKMLTVAGTRGDAIALIDHTHKDERPLLGATSVFGKVKELRPIMVGAVGKKEDARNYGAMFTPYAIYDIVTLNRRREIMPASFAYLAAVAQSVQTNANWYAVAGVTRGIVPNIRQLCQNVTGSIADAFQPVSGVSINPITNIKPYGYCIWGNRTTTFNNGALTASSFLNVRMLSNDVKKVVFDTAKKLTFELNSDILWLNFKAAIEPTLDKMVSGNGLTGYKIIRKATDKRATVEAIIKLYVVEAVEDWDIVIELSDTTVSVQ